MPPVIVSAKVAALLIAGVAACLDHASPAIRGGPIKYSAGWENCPAIVALAHRAETQQDASARAAVEAMDRQDYANAVKAVAALGVTP